MNEHEEWLNKSLRRYFRKLAKPRPEFGGHGICPSIAEYWDRVQIVHPRAPAKIQIPHIINMMRPLGLVATVLVYPVLPKGVLNVCDHALVDFPDIEILHNDPNLKGRINGVYTGYPHAHLIIIQCRETLQRSRENAKTSGYKIENTRV